MHQVKGVLTNERRHQQMWEAIETGLPFVKQCTEPTPGKLSIVCYGPSLLTTWKAIPRDQPLMTVSGTHDFLISRDIVPTFHVDIDPRPHKPTMLHPHNDVRYLMASVCHPSWWDLLHGYNVRLWHLIGYGDEAQEWAMKHHPEGLDSMIGGGSSVGQRAMNVAASVLGYKRFDMFGMDCSFSTDSRQYAGYHTGDPQPVIQTSLNNRTFLTTPQLLQSAHEMREFLLSTPDVEVTFHGDGFMQEITKVLKQRKPL